MYTEKIQVTRWSGLLRCFKEGLFIFPCLKIKRWEGRVGRELWLLRDSVRQCASMFQVQVWFTNHRQRQKSGAYKPGEYCSEDTTEQN